MFVFMCICVYKVICVYVGYWVCNYHCITISLCELNCIVNICIPIDIHVCGCVLVYVFSFF